MTARRTVDVDGSPVHVLESGDGPAVLLLHGSGPGTTGSGAWAATAEALGASWHLVAPDQAGFGRTPLPPGSRGGLRAVDGTGRRPDGCPRCRSPTPWWVTPWAAPWRWRWRRRAPGRSPASWRSRRWAPPARRLSAELDAVWAAPAGQPGARDMLSRLVLDQALVTETAVEARAAAMQAGASAFASMFPPPRARWADDLTLSAQVLAEVRAPVLLVHGAEDRVTPLRTAALPLLEHLADVRLHVLGRCGHVPAVEHPHDFWRLLSDFLRQE